MGNQPISVLPHLPACCIHKPSTSCLFDEDAMQLHKSKRKKPSPQPVADENDEMTYCLESSDCESDYTLSEPLALPSLIQSSTTSADHKLEEAVIAVSNHVTPPKRRKKKVARKEVSESESQLKHEQREKDLLKRENETLRKTISELRTKYNVMEAMDSMDSMDSIATESYEIQSITSNWSVSPRSDAPSAYSPNANRTYLSVSSDELEHSLANCMPLKRIIEALQWYSIHGNNHESVYQKMRHKGCGKQIADDYEHLMRYHLEGKDHVQREYNFICAAINRSVEPCAFQPCTGYRRYLRSRNCDNIHKAQTPKQHQLQTYVNTMDGIHCCFMHLAKSLQFKQ